MVDYSITRSDGTVIVSLAPLTADSTSTSLTLIGQGLYHYGQIFNDNYIRLMEHFALDTAPNAPVIGQLWWNKSNKLFKVWDGTVWIPLRPDFGPADTGFVTVPITTNVSINVLLANGKPIATISDRAFAASVLPANLIYREATYQFASLFPNGINLGLTLAVAMEPVITDNSDTLASTKWVQSQGYLTTSTIRTAITSSTITTALGYTPVRSINGATGAVVLTSANFPDIAPKNNPIFTGTATFSPIDSSGNGAKLVLQNGGVNPTAVLDLVGSTIRLYRQQDNGNIMFYNIASGDLTIGRNFQAGGNIIATGNFLTSNGSLTAETVIAANGTVVAKSAVQRYLTYQDDTGSPTGMIYQNPVSAVNGTGISSLNQPNNIYLSANGAGNFWIQVTPTGDLYSQTGSFYAQDLYAFGNLRTSGNVYMSGYVANSVATAISATGTVQGNALTLAASLNEVTTTPLNSGVILPAVAFAAEITVWNRGVNNLNVYPPAGTQIDSYGTNNPVVLYPNCKMTFAWVKFGQWYTVGSILQMSIAAYDISILTIGGTDLVSKFATKLDLTGGNISGNLTVAGNLTVGDGSALAATATTPFLVLSNISGPPTGNAPAGATVIDRVANKLWVCVGSGSWKSVTLT